MYGGGSGFHAELEGAGPARALPSMTLAEFLATLADEGVARVRPAALVLEDGPHFERELRELHRRAALELAGPAPPLDLGAARRGALLLHRLAAGIHLGNSREEPLAWTPPDAPPPPADAAEAFSADLALRWLPDLERLALGLAPDDARRASLRAVARAHPLSSVGVRGLGPLEPGVLVEHEGLARLYVDRALKRGAPERLTHPRLSALARTATGAST